MPGFFEDIPQKKKVLILKITLSIAVAYLCVSLLYFVKNYYGLDADQLWFTFIISSIVSGTHLAIDTIVDQHEPKSEAAEEPEETVEKSVGTPLNKIEQNNEMLLNACNKLEHKYEEISMLGRKMQSALRRVRTPQLSRSQNDWNQSPLNSSQFLSQIRSSNALTPSVLDVSPIEKPSYVEGNSEVFTKDASSLSPFSEFKSPSTYLRKIAAKNNLENFVIDNELNEAKLNIELSSFNNELSQSSDSKKLNENIDCNSNFSNDSSKINELEVKLEKCDEKQAKLCDKTS